MTIINTSLSADHNTLTIDIQGRFDFNALSLFRGAYEKISPKPAAYIVELSGAEYLDSSALGMLLALKDHAGGNVANICLKNPSADVKKILVITQLDKLFNIE